MDFSFHIGISKVYIFRANNYKLRIIIACILLFLFYPSVAQNIIIADDTKQTAVFSTENKGDIIRLAQSISKDYKKVILHLGRSYVFKNGNIYGNENSRDNLALFCSTLKDNGSKVYLWFFDSFGGDSFLQLYNSHKEITNRNLTDLEQYHIPYDGIAIDMENINRGGFNNNGKYIEVVKYLRDRLGDKKLFCFASLLDNKQSNSSRGYDTKQILQYADNMIDMLYVQEADFFVPSHPFFLFFFPAGIMPKLNVARIKSLKKYYNHQHWLIAISLQDGYAIPASEADTYELLPELKNPGDSYLSCARYKRKRKNKYSVMYQYKLTKDCILPLANGQTIHLKKKEALFHFELRPQKIVGKNDFIWEYFNIQKQ